MEALEGKLLRHIAGFGFEGTQSDWKVAVI